MGCEALSDTAPDAWQLSNLSRDVGRLPLAAVNVPNPRKVEATAIHQAPGGGLCATFSRLVHSNRKVRGYATTLNGK